MKKTIQELQDEMMMPDGRAITNEVLSGVLEVVLSSLWRKKSGEREFRVDEALYLAYFFGVKAEDIEWPLMNDDLKTVVPVRAKKKPEGWTYKKRNRKRDGE